MRRVNDYCGFQLFALLVLPVLLPATARSSVDMQEPPALHCAHPRMFFNRETWPAIVEYAKGDGRSQLKWLLDTCDSYPTNPVCTGMEMPAPEKRLVDGKWVEVPFNGDTPIRDIRDWGGEAAAVALAWRFTGEAKYLELAKRMIRENARAYNLAYDNGRAVSWYSFGRINTFCAYDWIYEALTADERRELALPLLKHVEAALRPPRRIHRRDGSTWNGGCYGVPSLAWYAGLMSAGDGVDDAAAARFLKEGWQVSVKMLDFRNRGAGDDGALSGGVVAYSLGAYPHAHFNFIRTVRSACGVDLAPEFPALALFPNWVWWTWMPSDDSPNHPFNAGIGDTYHASGRMEIGSSYEHMLQYAQVFGEINPAAAKLAMALAALAPNRSIGGTFPIYRFLLDPKTLPAPYTQAQLEASTLKARHFETLGHFDLRSAWRPGGTFATFSAGALLQTHKHNDENSFVIFKHDLLALDTGTRGNQTDYNLKHYYSQTVAHNAILIHKPGEKLPFHWGLELKDPKYNYNYGGQFPESARVEAFETNDEYTYIASDAAKCYGAKCRRALRQFVHVQPDFFVVYDRIETDGEYPVEFLLHTENEPKIENRLLVADSRGGRLTCETLLPKSAQLGKVGGPGREYWANGRNWEVDEKYLAGAANECRRHGSGPYFGQWRLEVKPAAPGRETHFLHVLTATDSAAGQAVKCEYVEDGEHEGVRLQLPSGRSVEFDFNRTGAAGGAVVLGDVRRPLATAVQPQCGVLLH